MKKKAIIGGFLVVGIGVSAYLWSRFGMGQIERDTSAMAKVQKYTCPKCGHHWEMTMAESLEMRKSKSDIVCPSCGQGDAQKEGVVIAVSGNKTFGGDEDKKESTEEQPTDEAPKKPALSSPGRTKKTNP